MRPPLRVAVAQTAPRSRDITGNIADAVENLGAAAGEGARLVVFPELALTGYDPSAWSVQEAVDPGDPVLAPLAEAAAALAVTVVTSAAVRRPGGLSLSAVVVSPAGEIRAPYDKQHLSGPECDAFLPGGHGATIVVDGWELGLGICFDSSFPDHARDAAVAGADAYVCPSVFFRGSEHRRDLIYPARALDNGMYVVFAGAVGPCGDRESSGGSAIYDPEGRVLARAGDRPALVIGDLEAAEVDRVRASGRALGDAPASHVARERWVMT